MLRKFLVAKVKRSINDSLLFTKTKVNIKVNEGIVRGVIEKLPNGQNYMRFSNIPYAKPPINELKFKSPQKLLKFNKDEIDCTREGHPCPQRSTVTKKYIGSEDCLHLNVYAPADPDSSKKKAVMVFIHGGGFLMDSNSVDFYSPEYLLMEDVIVVSINYRLHALGFLMLPSMGINGNAGLKDQQMALEWVYNNISNFNGDPEKICLFGESAGAVSVHLHVLNEKSRGMISSAICQSGCAINNWSFPVDIEEKSRRLGEKFGASRKSDKDILDALLKAPHDRMFNFQRDIQDPDEIRRNLPFVFKPCIERESDDAFMTMSPLNSLRAQKNKINIPMIFGCNSIDGSTMSVYFRNQLKKFNEDPVKMIPQTINIDPSSKEAIKLGKEISKFYFGKEGLNEKTFDKFIDLNTDNYFTVNQMMVRNLNNEYQKNLKQFFYQFDYDGELSFLKKVLKISPKIIKGAAHFDELSYLFRHQIIDVSVSQDSSEYKMRNLMVKMWTNFAKFHDPTPDNSLDFKWSSDQGKDELNYLLIQENPKMIENIQFKRINFWKRIYVRYNGSFITSI